MPLPQPRPPGLAPLGLATALAMLAGVTAVMGLAALPPAALFGCSGLVAACAWWRGRRLLRLGGAMLLGFALAGLHGHHALSLRIDPQSVGVDLDVKLRVTGLVRHADGSTAGPGGSRSARAFTGFDARLVSVPDAPELEGRRVSLGWYGEPPSLEPGQRWAMRLRLKRPRGVLNPGGADRERRALEQRLAATGYVRAPERARQLSAGRGLDAWRSRTGSALRERVSHPGMRFVLGLALGDTRGIQPRDWEALRATGLTHLLAISGFHVGVVAGMGALLAGALSRLWPAAGRWLPRPMLMAWAALACALVYAAAAGFSLPTQRAVLMIGAALLARLTRRPVVPATGFALALWAVLLVDPLAVLAPGFWLSFLGVGWLLWCLGGSQGGQRAPTYFGALLGSQWVATVGLLPLTAWFFGQASMVGPLANLVGIPLVTLLVVPLSLLGTLVVLAWPVPGEALLLGAALLAEHGAAGMRQLAAWPGAMRHVAAAGLVALGLAMAAAVWLLMPRGVPGRALAPLLLLPMLWPRPASLPAGGFELHLFDVGQGLSLLVRTRSHALLFDTGPRVHAGPDMGAVAVVPSLRALGVRRLDAIVVSHGDNDHAGGLDSVLRAYPGTPVWGQQHWLARAAPHPVQACIAGGGWHWDGIDFAFLHPTPHFPDLGNDGSCVLRVGGPAGAVLLPGDIGRVVERRLVRQHGSALGADVLVLAHHGSRHSSATDFLEAVSPTQALNGSAHASRFNHPHPDVLERLHALRVELSDTGEHGHVRMRLLPGRPVAVERRREAFRRFWHER